MANIATSVRVSADASEILDRLADKLQQPKAQVVQLALKQLEESIFWEDVRQAYDRVAADPNESAEHKAAFDHWDKGTARDYQESEW